MKLRNFLFPLLLILLSPTVASCSPKNGGVEFFSAKEIGTTPYQEEKSIKISNHEFIYYNVYSNNNGDFILADNTSYIMNTDLSFGIRFKFDDRVVISKLDSFNPLEPICTTYENGDYGYQVSKGFKITVSPILSMVYRDINIGKIGNWC